jgi:predicted  nucleic acid-binding Zn-ribbon protein
MTCKECGKTFSDEYGYCPYCGTEKRMTLAESMDNDKSDRRRLAELAISERVFKRSLVWFGILSSPLLVAFGIVGFQLNHFLENTKEQVDIRTKSAIAQIGKAEDYARSTIDTSKAVQKDLDDARQVVSQVRRLRADVNSLQSQVEGFYKTQIRELFGGHQNEGRYSGSVGNWVVTLKKQPITGSLRVRCGAIELYPENYQLAGSSVTVKCDLDLKPVASSNINDQNFIEIFYHPKN